MANKLPAIPAVIGLSREIARYIGPIKERLERMSGERVGDGTETVVTTGTFGNQFTTTPSGILVPGGSYNPATDTTPPPQASGLGATGAIKYIIVDWTPAVYRNHAYTEVWRDTVNVLDPYHAVTNPTGTTQMIGQAGGSVMTDETASRGTTYYYWIRFVSQANITGNWNAGIGGGVSAALADLTVAEFASGINPVEIFSVLPAPGDQGRLVFLTTDKKLYRDNGATWTAAVDGADIDPGTVDGAAIVTDSITAGQIAVGAISASELAAGAIQVGTAVIQNGAIVNAMLGTAAVDKLNVADAAITNAKLDRISANKVVITTADISAAAITSALIGNAQILSAHIANAQINTAHIGTAQVNTLQVAGDAVTATASQQLTTDFQIKPSEQFNVMDTLWQDIISLTVNAGADSLTRASAFLISTSSFKIRVTTGAGSNDGTIQFECRIVESSGTNAVSIEPWYGYGLSDDTTTKSPHAVYTLTERTGLYVANGGASFYATIPALQASPSNTANGNVTYKLQWRKIAFSGGAVGGAIYAQAGVNMYMVGAKR